MRPTMTSPSFGLVNSPIKAANPNFSAGQMVSNPATAQPSAVKFGGSDDRLFAFGLFSLFIGGVLGGVAWERPNTIGKLEQLEQLEQENYELKEPACAQVIKDKDDFERIVEEAGGRENVECGPDGFKILKK